MAPIEHMTLLQQLYFHVALPRNTPGKEDGNLHRIEGALLARLSDAAAQLDMHALPQHQSDVRGLQETLLACKSLNVDGTIPKSGLLRELRCFSGNKVLVLHVSAQNCAVLMHNEILDSGERQVVFEAFEASASCEKVLACKNALLWDFPGSALAVPSHTFSEESFQQSLALFLEQASAEMIMKFVPTTVKASANLPEIRDTNAPDVVSGLLMTILEANGVALTVPLLRKRVRDTVSFDNARKPWRRSPFYLVLRVAMQRYLYRRLGPEVGRLYYKLTMCLALSQLLEDMLKRTPLEAAFLLRQKLGRRLAKLEADMANASGGAKSAYVHVLRSIEPQFTAILSTTGGYLKTVWKNYKSRNERRVSRLRPRAYDHERSLQLLNSGRTLTKLLTPEVQQPKTPAKSPSELLQQYEQSMASSKPYMTALSHYITTATYIEEFVLPAKSSALSTAPCCIELSKAIQDCIRHLDPAMNRYPDQTSQMLLHVLELWVLMDTLAVKSYPLLLDFHPALGSDILEPLQFLAIEELDRVRDVQVYLEARCEQTTGKQRSTIFDDPSDHCFAARYYDDSPMSDELLLMRENIEERAASALEAKEVEWEEKSSLYKETVQKRDQRECKWAPVTSHDGIVEHKHQLPCEWHNLHIQAKRIRIDIFEHPLPSYEPAAKAALFEMRCPKAFAAYRDATWRILSTLCHPAGQALENISLVREYKQLRSYVNVMEHEVALASRIDVMEHELPLGPHIDVMEHEVTLGSNKKAHLDSHYANWGFPVGLSEVCRSCGLKPRYYDSVGRVWTGDPGKASFWHHFAMMLNPGSPYYALQLSYAGWPSSNQIEASRPNCPSDINNHEFLAWQGLLVGTHSRWLDLLREMGSTNLNFSSDSPWVLVQRLAYQVGPATTSEEVRRDVHSAFVDEAFCRKILEQVRPRLESIRRNWREPVQMDILITVLLKISSFSPFASIRDEATTCLLTVRCITDSWRAELQNIVTQDTGVLQYIIWSSLLCKRTVHLQRHSLLEPGTLRPFIDASIMLHYYLTGNFNNMPHILQHAIVRDLLFVYENREFLKDAILANAQCFRSAVDGLWKPPDCAATQCLLQVSGTCWIEMTIKSAQVSHCVHYNYLYGTFLVNGEEMRSLPLAYRKHPTYRQIFADRNPIVFTSPLSGMTFQIAETMKEGHRIHLGFRQSELVVRALQNNEILELVPPSLFSGVYSSDLPATLIHSCYHWLNVHTGVLEIRQKDIWRSRPSNWRIFGLRTQVREAVRNYQGPKETRLLEPTSAIVRSIAQVFDHFETPGSITTFVSADGNITVELKRYELSFFINQDGLLQSRRLGAIIPQSQDAGTWYGLKSKIVVQSTANNRQKSILVPLGTVQASKDGFHVSVTINGSEGDYSRFAIDEVLGRINCAPEPRLLYTKALLHAYTSSVMYDPLTRRTGAEEALYLLQTGSHLPWNPLLDTTVGILKSISALSPVRRYYPKEKKCMETIVWKPDFPISTQDDRYRAIIAKIIRRSSELSKFHSRPLVEIAVNLPTNEEHLTLRAITLSYPGTADEDVEYHARDRRTEAFDRRNVLNMTKLLLQWRTLSTDGPALVSLLQDAPVIGGYDKFFQKCLLSDLLAVDLRAEWGGLTQKFLNSDTQDRYQLMFLLGPIAFSEDVNIDLMRILVSFAMLPQIRTLAPPKYPAYFHYRADGAPPSSYLVSFMDKAKMPFNAIGFKKRSLVVVAEDHHEKHVEQSCEALADSIRDQWPSARIDLQKLVTIDSVHLDVERALADVYPEWTRLTQNHELTLYLEQVQAILWSSSVPHATVLPSQSLMDADTAIAVPEFYPSRSRNLDDLSLPILLQVPLELGLTPHSAATTARSFTGPPTTRSGNVNGSYKLLEIRAFAKPMPTKSRRGINELKAIVMRIKDRDSFVQSRYADELMLSIQALQSHFATRKDVAPSTCRRITTNEILPAKNLAFAAMEQIRSQLQNNDPQAKWLQLVDLWPRLTVVDLLTELRATSGTVFGRGAKEALVNLGLAISEWQQLLRIQDAQKKWSQQQEKDEWANSGHTNWNPLDYPDWLLLEIDGDILLREEQIEVALATIAPPSGRNSVLQLLMGKGKTSCILPMVAAVLADKSNLARIVVPRALLLQSAQVMQAKLGGLVNREIIHIPFSRKTSTSQTLMQLYGHLHAQSRRSMGVMLTLPEHILSFKLSGVQQLCDDHIEQAATMIKIQDWLDKHARDVLDECDVSLAIRTQLIYPSGSQTTVNGHPLRWQVTQALLHLVKDFSVAVQSRHPRSIEIVRRGVDSFPLIYFLRKDAEEYLVALLVGIICKGQMPSILPCAEYPVAVTNDVEVYISSPTVHGHVINRMIEYFGDKPHIMRTVNLLRGLFVHRILIATLKKRWNVQYGLHPTRAPIAVPYLAKGVPSPAAEWGHPDVAIVLTCLSFYYQGLSTSQFRQAFEYLSKTDEPCVEYEKWFPKGIDVPRELDDYTAINVDDSCQLNELYCIVRANTSLVDFYLNNFVFPKYAKTFSLKLQASGWNLFPSISIRQAGCQVTGFSGTNDSIHQLPMLIKQKDLKQLAHTNAEVPLYLLEARNSSYVRMTNPATGTRWTELNLISNLANPSRHTQQETGRHDKIRILIDAGAQILEHSNKDLAKAWLQFDHDAAAAVYFDDDHRAWVLYRGGNRPIPLLASPFANDLDRCVVYLDESHCRGTDLKFPAHARAALTLGQHLTKDALVQAAMRLRLLGESQSVTFFAPPEVHQGIVDRLDSSNSRHDIHQPISRINSAAVLQWVFSLTCDTIEQLETLYFAQTSHYLQQEQARIDCPDFLETQQSRIAYRSVVRIKETLSLKQLYEPRSQRRAARSGTDSWHPALHEYAAELVRRKQHFQDRGTAVHASALEEVEIEQEREAEVEIETEVEDIREVQQAMHLTAYKIRPLHEDIRHFATTGILVAGSNAFRPMFSVLGHTALGLKHAVSRSMKSNVWVSTEFNRTVEVYQPLDNYIRSCQWVLWSPASEKALIVSPEEANALIPILRTKIHEKANTKAHLIVYAAPVTRRMLQFNRLDFHTTPPLPDGYQLPVWLRVELGIFSGRLYFEWDEYYELLGYLGLNKDLSRDENKHSLAKKPLIFLHEWLALRRNGQDFEHTPMGFVTTGKPLTENHPFFRSAAHGAEDVDARPTVARVTAGRPVHADDDEDDGDHDDLDFVPAVEHIDDSEGEEDNRSSEDEDFTDALEDYSE